MIKTNIEVQRENEYFKQWKEYSKKLDEYNSLGFVLKAFALKPVEPVKAKPLKVGERFAIKYGQICVPIHSEEVIYTHGLDMHVIDTIGSLGIGKDFDEMWTIVEYQEDGTFKDLLTGIVLSRGIIARDPYEIFYDRNLDESLKQLIDTPFGISGCNTHFVNQDVVVELTEITPEIQSLFQNETIPAMDQIMEAMGKKRAKNEEVINNWLESYIIANESVINFISVNYPKLLASHLEFIESLKNINESSKEKTLIIEP